MVRQSEEGYYDLIFMDIQMPVMDGYQAAKVYGAWNAGMHAICPLLP